MRNTTEEYRQMRMGETRKMNCGMEATIINYENSQNITIRFKNGITKDHVAYSLFAHGLVRYEGKSKTYAKKRLGETKVMDDGVSGTIISYVNSGDIDVSLENGTVIRHTTYHHFTNGLVHKRRIDKVKEEKTGQIIKLKNGDTCKIINYRNSRDVDIQFSDGTIRQHVRYGNVKKGYAAKA